MAQDRSQNQPSTGSMLLVEEYFAREDDRFVAELRNVPSPKALAPFAEKWKKDRRPWARSQQLAYFSLPFDRPGHEPVVKRLFKQAHHAGDDELMGACLLAFDRLVRRRRRLRNRYDWQTRSSWQELTIELPQNRIPHQKLSVGAKVPHPFYPGEFITVSLRVRKNGRLFTHLTRYYLRRRAARYFRQLGNSHPARYVSAVGRALRQYTDADLAQGEDVLECWGLLQIAFRHSRVLLFGPARVQVKPGESLGQLQPAPRFLKLWQEPSAADELISLLVEANSRLVRQWALQLLRREHGTALSQVEIDVIFALLNSPHEDAQQVGAELLLGSSLAGRLSVGEWLRLVEVPNPTILATICEAMQKHVTADRLTLAQCVALASAAPTPVARLGLRFLQSRKIISREDRVLIAGLADARCESTGGSVAAWALQWCTAESDYDRDLVMPFLDSMNADVRSATWRWMREGSPAYDDPLIWVRLTETPFDDVRAQVVASLQQRSALPGALANDLAPLWTAVLLNVHRGGRDKIKAAAQISRAIATQPEHAEKLIPVLGVAVRSVRPAEMRTGLAAIMSLITKRPELAIQVRACLPELSFGSLENEASEASP